MQNLDTIFVTVKDIPQKKSETCRNSLPIRHRHKRSRHRQRNINKIRRKPCG